MNWRNRSFADDAVILAVETYRTVGEPLRVAGSDHSDPLYRRRETRARGSGNCEAAAFWDGDGRIEGQKEGMYPPADPAMTKKRREPVLEHCAM